MKIVHHAIDRPRIIWVATAFFLLVSGFAMLEISVQRTPAIHTPVVVVAVPYLGAKPNEVEDQITRKIEENLNALENVDWMVSESLRGVGVISIIFLDNVDRHEARTNVEHLVNEVRAELPAGREVQPRIVLVDFESQPLMLVSLSPPDGYDERALRTIAEEVQDEIESIPGVANTGLFGGREREIQVQFFPDLMRQYGIPLEQLKKVLSESNATLPAGNLNTSGFDLQVRSETKFRDLDDIRETVIGEQEGRIIHVHDVAEVIDTYERPKSLSKLDGRASATIFVNKEADINAMQTAQEVQSTIEGLRQKYPHIDISWTRDVSAEIRLMFEILGSSAVFGGFLVLIILCIAMGLRVSILVLMAIPFSTAVALFFFYATGTALSNMALFSYVLVLGMVVDGAIIVAENIHRHLEEGLPPVEAAKKGIDEVGIPVLAADCTTIAAFLPMLLIPGIMGDFMGIMPLVVSVALLGSVLVDHFLIPTVAAVWYTKVPLKHTKKTHTSPAEPRSEQAATKGWFSRILGKPFEWFAKGYEKALIFSLAHTWVVLIGCFYAVCWAGLMLTSGAIGSDFFPASDRGLFQVDFELPLGYSLEEAEQAAKTITGPILELKEKGELKHFVTALGSSQALSSPMEGDAPQGPEFGKVLVELTPPTERERDQQEIIQELRDKIQLYPGMTYKIETIQEGPPGGAAVQLRLLGDDLDAMSRLVTMLETELRGLKGTIDIHSNYRPDNPEIIIEPDPAVTGLLGMSELQVSNTIASATLGDDQLEMVIDDEEVAVRIQAAPEFRNSLPAIRALPVRSPSGRWTEIGELGEVKLSTGLFGIYRYNRKRMLSVYCNLIDPGADPENGAYADDIFGQLRTILPEKYGFRGHSDGMTFIGGINTPSEGIRLEFTGENEEKRKNEYHLTKTMVIAILLIGTILVIQFNSFRQTFIVLISVPLSFVGVVLGMWICKFPFSLASFIGLVSLTGIVVNDAIVMVDFINQARKRGLPLYEALLEAGRTRLRPVMLTTITTIGGLLPLFLNWSGGAEFWQPLTGAIIFGLMTASLLTLLIIPAFYSVIYDWKSLYKSTPALERIREESPPATAELIATTSGKK
ncbi:Efflux RND transporter permease subunit [Planctomycetales bacterium 10988]|nr:Efflux RND transporter permease subunit [Planctomycetales bacterium 10988]